MNYRWLGEKVAGLNAKKCKDFQMKRAKKRTNQAPSLLEKILRRRARVGVVGLGYVGLPLAVAFAQHGFPVTGIDIDRDRVNSLNKGKNYLTDLKGTQLKKLVTEKRLRATTDWRVLADLDTVSICVPTPLRKTRDPDISYIVAVTEQIQKYLHKGQLIVLESTTYPGTTEEILLPQLSSTGLKVGEDFFLAFSPERIDPGNSSYTLKNTPKVIGGTTERCTQVAALLYRTIAEQIVPVGTTKTAEMVKLLENTFRAVNIGLVNEIALICDRLGVNTWEVISAAATKPFGFMPFYPGPGLGGHCIPVDPHYLSWKLRSMDYTARFIELAREVNQEMPAHVFKKIQGALNQKKKPLKGAKILLLGVAYKKNVADTRESPAYDVGKLLHEAGAQISYVDPWVPNWVTDWGKLKSKPWNGTTLKNCDCAVVLADHDAFNIAELILHAPLIVDTRNAVKNHPQKKVFRL
jgi:UDP-N-acetyl-D-glucosamine dehydrogenase